MVIKNLPIKPLKQQVKENIPDITLKEVYEGFKACKDLSGEQIYDWAVSVWGKDDVFLYALTPSCITDKVKERDVLRWALIKVEELSFEIFSDKYARSYAKYAADEIDRWYESEGEDFPEEIYEIIMEQYDCDSIDNQSEETQQLYKKCLDHLCDKKLPRAIQERGYCYYCGTKVYPNDWVKARDSFIEYYKMSADPSAANTLGYIYYYGRCNGGVPEYENAFKYFSIGHAGGMYESTYKLADMFRHGYVVEKNEETAFRLYSFVYKETKEKFEKGIFEGKFADAALRIGTCFKDGIHVPKDAENAYFYYLQAEYAILKRMATVNYYGDKKVLKGIEMSIKQVRKEYTDTGLIDKIFYPAWLKWILDGGNRCKVVIKKRKNGRLVLKATPVAKTGEGKKRFLATVPKADFCELLSKLIIVTSKGSRCFTEGRNKEIVIDHFEYDFENGTTNFYLEGKCVCKIKTKNYFYKVPFIPAAD